MLVYVFYIVLAIIFIVLIIGLFVQFLPSQALTDLERRYQERRAKRAGRADRSPEH